MPRSAAWLGAMVRIENARGRSGLAGRLCFRAATGGSTAMREERLCAEAS
jgi:hypothetical protein